MKYVLTSFILIICMVSWSQQGYELIRKAEVKIEKGHYQKALRLLDRADKSSYGFCGLGYFAGKEGIAINRAKIYDQLGESQKAGDEINSIFFAMHCNNLDSLKTVYYINQFGKEYLKKEIDSCINSMPRGVLDTIHYADNIGFDVNFSENPFLISHVSLSKIMQESRASYQKDPEQDFFELFKAAIRHQPFYQLLE